jgi:hypothetical protein
VCQRWGQSCDPDSPDSDQLRRLVNLELELGQFGPQCRAIGMDCLGDGQDASYFVAPGRALDPGWMYAVVGTLATATSNATYVGLSINDLTKLKGVVNISDIELAGSAASYAGDVENTDKFFVHYFNRNCGSIEGLTDGECTTISQEMVPLLGVGAQGPFSAVVRSYVRPGTARRPRGRVCLRSLRSSAPRAGFKPTARCDPGVTPDTRRPPTVSRIVRFWRRTGAGEWTRTTDLLITNQLLYQLSYAGKAWRCTGSSVRPERRIVARRHPPCQALTLGGRTIARRTGAGADIPSPVVP